MYTAKNGNISYVVKVLGSPTAKLDKCIFGVLITGIILALLVGPLWFFSDVGGFIAPNPVTAATISFSFVIHKTMSQNDLNGMMDTSLYQLDNNSTFLLESENLTDHKAIKSKIPYIFYENANPFFRQYDKDYYE